MTSPRFFIVISHLNISNPPETIETDCEMEMYDIFSSAIKDKRGVRVLDNLTKAQAKSQEHYMMC